LPELASNFDPPNLQSSSSWDYRCTNHLSQSRNFFFLKISLSSQVSWCLPIIPELGKMRKEDQDFKDNLNYIVTLRPA
jgi:hypothetical protein